MMLAKEVKEGMGGQRFTKEERAAARLTPGGRKKKINVAAPHHRPRSAPGEPPAVQTARLIRSITYEVDKAALVVRVGTNVKYGKWLEYGTRTKENTVKMQPRPFLRPALRRKQAEMLAYFQGLLG